MPKHNHKSGKDFYLLCEEHEEHAYEEPGVCMACLMEACLKKTLLEKEKLEQEVRDLKEELTGGRGRLLLL
jgi:hypothetical protein